MTKLDLAHLAEVAGKATPGPWFHRQPAETLDWIGDHPERGRHTKIIVQRDSLYGGSADYAFIAAANPAVILALIDRLREAEGEWQPIESAPKDGTAVLVMRDIWPGTPTGRAMKCNAHNTYVAAWWAGAGDDGSGAWVCYMDLISDPLCPVDPTHWMPLPPPPE